VGFSRPISDRFMVAVGAFYIDDMVSEDQRTITLRLDDIWSISIGLEWQWKPKSAIKMMLNYVQMGDAPVSTPDIPLIGAVTGAYTVRRTLYPAGGYQFWQRIEALITVAPGPLAHSRCYRY